MMMMTMSFHFIEFFSIDCIRIQSDGQSELGTYVYFLTVLVQTAPNNNFGRSV